MPDVLTRYLSACPELNLLDPQAAAYMFVGTLIFFLNTHAMLHGQDILRMERDRLVDHLIAVCCTANRGLEH